MIKSVTSRNALGYLGDRKGQASTALSNALVSALIDIAAAGESTPVTSIAERFSFSSAQIRRLCKAILGETADSFALRLRLERAAGQLAETDHAVALVAKEAGFAAREPFTRSFSAHFGCSPSDFRHFNHDARLAFPGQVLASGRDFERSVVVATSASSRTRFLFDGPIFLGRVFSNGFVDWRSEFRRPSFRCS
jgi:AraC-like DNA-binding protein